VKKPAARLGALGVRRVDAGMMITILNLGMNDRRSKG